MDPRLIHSTDSAKVDKMGRAALLCLSKDSGHKFMISEVCYVHHKVCFVLLYRSIKFSNHGIASDAL